MASKYDPWRRLLAAQTGPTATYTFAHLESLLPDHTLPPTAYRREQWWRGREIHRHVQMKAWRELGWVAKPHLPSKTVTFHREDA
jgi:hypothetical protein